MKADLKIISLLLLILAIARCQRFPRPRSDIEEVTDGSSRPTSVNNVKDLDPKNLSPEQIQDIFSGGDGKSSGFRAQSSAGGMVIDLPTGHSEEPSFASIPNVPRTKAYIDKLIRQDKEQFNLIQNLIRQANLEGKSYRPESAGGISAPFLNEGHAASHKSDSIESVLGEQGDPVGIVEVQNNNIRFSGLSGDPEIVRNNQDELAFSRRFPSERRLWHWFIFQWWKCFKRGLTFRKTHYMSSFNFIMRVGPSPQSQNWGDTFCYIKKPLLCSYVLPFPRPAPLPYLSPPSLHSWSGGIVATTPPIRGCFLIHPLIADLVCRYYFRNHPLNWFWGNRWRAAYSYMGSFQRGYWAYGNLPNNGNRYWVNDPFYNCY